MSTPVVRSHHMAILDALTHAG